MLYSNRDSMKENINLINSYLRYVSKKEEDEKDYNKDFKTLEDAVIDNLNSLTFKGLVELYIKYTDLEYVKTYENLNSFIDLIYQNIINKLGSISLVKTIDIYADVFLTEIKLDEDMRPHKDIVVYRTPSLLDDNYVQGEAIRKQLSKDDYLERQREFINYHKIEVEKYETSIKYIDKLQTSLVTYIEASLIKLSEIDKNELEIAIGTRIINNSLEIIKMKELLKDKGALDSRSKMNEIHVSNIRLGLIEEIRNLENKEWVYKNYANPELVNEKKK